MKKSLFAVAAAALLLTGCTSIESTQKFNALGLGTPNEKAVCQTLVQIPGYFFFGLPIFVGSNKGDNEWTMFEWSLTTENVVYLLTKEVKSKGAARVINVQITRTKNPLLLPFFSYETIQASGTGVRTKGAAIRQAVQQYEMQP